MLKRQHLNVENAYGNKHLAFSEFSAYDHLKSVSEKLFQKQFNQIGLFSKAFCFD